MEKTEIRLNKFLAERLGISRSKADELITAGKVTVNGEIAVLGQKVCSGLSNIDKNDKVCYNGRIVSSEVEFTYIGMNKPVGYVCSKRKQGESETIFALLPEKYQNLKTVGRLDKNSSGLILLTDDGDFAFRMTHPKFEKTKVYEVELDHDLAPLHRQMITEFGIEIGDGVSKFMLERIEGERKWRVIMKEGRNRQIRRTFGALGYEVVKLHRVQFGPYLLGNLASGKIEKISVAS